MARKRGLVVISDEIYELFGYSGKTEKSLGAYYPEGTLAIGGYYSRGSRITAGYIVNNNSTNVARYLTNANCFQAVETFRAERSGSIWN